MGKVLRQLLLLLLLLSWLVSSSQFSRANRKLLQDDEQDPSPRGGGGEEMMDENDDLEEDPPDQQLREEPAFQEEPTLPIQTDNTEEEEPVRNNQDDSMAPLRSRRPQRPERVEEEDSIGSLVDTGGVMSEVKGGLPLMINEDSVLEETIDETTPLNCNGFYDEQCCIALRAAGAGRISPCCWDRLCAQTAPFGGETYLANCMNRTC